MYVFKQDEFRKARGGISRVLDITCSVCAAHVTYYQKDGPGILKRMYVDRFIDTTPSQETLKCGSCGETLGLKMNYKKESRPAYRLFVGAVNKKIVSKNRMANF